MRTAADPPFTGRVSRWVRASKEHFERVHTEVVRRGLSSAVSLTPVDTGRARASWRVASGRPDLSADRRSDRGPNFAAEVLAGDAVLAAQYVKALRVRSGGVVWITNNVHYAIPLEGPPGHSKQSDMMLRRTWGRLIAELPLIVEQTR